MTIREIQSGGVLSLALTGELDLTGGPELTAFLEGKLSGTEKLVLDMQEVRYISSAGIRAVLAAKKSMGEREVCLAHCNEMVTEAFEVTGLDEFFTMEA